MHGAGILGLYWELIHGWSSCGAYATSRMNMVVLRMCSGTRALRLQECNGECDLDFVHFIKSKIHDHTGIPHFRQRQGPQ